MLTEPVKATVYFAERWALAGWAVNAAAAAATTARRGRRERMAATVPADRRRSIGGPPKHAPGAAARTGRDQAAVRGRPATRAPNRRSGALVLRRAPAGRSARRVRRDAQRERVVGA